MSFDFSTTDVHFPLLLLAITYNIDNTVFQSREEYSFLLLTDVVYCVMT